MWKTPNDCPTGEIHKLSELEADAMARERINADLERAIRLLSNSETVLKPKRRRMEYDRVPVGHDIGYRCYDGDKHDADSAFQSGEYADGLSENEAYAAWLRQDAENNPKPRPTRKIYSSGAREEPDDYSSQPEPELSDD